jgi:hypothetical protein
MHFMGKQYTYELLSFINKTDYKKAECSPFQSQFNSGFNALEILITL